MRTEKRKEGLRWRERTGLKNPKEDYSSHLGYEAGVLRYARLVRFSSGHLTIVHLMAAECLEGDVTVSL